MSEVENTPVSLSPLQRQIWLRRDNSHAGVVQAAFVLTGDWDLSALEDTICRAVEREDTLQMMVTETGNGLVSTRKPNSAIPRPHRIELRGSGDIELENTLQHQREQLCSLHTGPLFSSALLTQEAGATFVAFTASRLCADASTLLSLADKVVELHQRGVLESDAVSFLQVAPWLNELGRGADGKAGSQFWAPRREGVQAPAPIRPVQGRPLWKSSLLDIRLPARQKVEQQAAERTVASEDLMVAAWATLWAKIFGKDDVPVGWVDSGRSLGPLKQLAGPLDFAVPLRLAVLDTNELHTRIQRAKMERALIGEHALLLPALLDLEGCLGTAPTPAVQLHVLPPRCRALEGYSAHLVSLWDPPEQAALRLSVVPQGADYAVVVNADTTRINIAEASLVAREWCHELEQLLTPPKGPPDHALTSAQSTTQSSIVERLLGTARLHADACAVRDKSGSMSYSELVNAVESLAAQLRQRGAGPEKRVALCHEPSCAMLVGFLGILHSGATAVPLNPQHPGERQRWLLQDADCIAAVASTDCTHDLVQGGMPCLQPLGHSKGSQTPPLCEPHHLAYIVYTSGSTGHPKGVCVEHRQLVHYADAIVEKLECEAGDSFGLMTNLSADLGYTSLVASLTVGGVLSIFDDSEIRDSRVMSEALRRQPVDFMKTTPSHFLALNSGTQGGVHPRKALILGGEGLSVASLAEPPLDGRSYKLFNHYGPTECTVGVLIGTLEGPLGAPLQTLPLTSTLGSNQVWVLDRALSPVRAWQIGEVYIQGPSVARGYLKHPGETASRFVPAIAGPPGTVMYRTGDLARVWPDGSIELLGRRDHQVSLRGFRVELEEVEAALESHSLVQKAVAELRTDPHGTPFLAAHVLASVGSDRIIDDLPTHDLPNGMVVAHVNRSETEFLWQEIFERRTYFQHGIQLADDATVFDIGANIGMFTLQVSASSPSARVYSFEPIARTHRVLARNAMLYAPRAKVFHAGVSDHPHTVQFVCYPRQTMMSGVSAYASSQEEEEVVRTFMANSRQCGTPGADILLQSLDELLEGRFEGEEEACQMMTISQVIREEGIEHIDLLKVDVQRAELDVLNGIETPHWALIGQVCMEFHDGGSGSPTDGRGRFLTDLLQRHGFEVVIEQDPMLKTTDRWSLYAISKRRRPASSLERDLTAWSAPTALSAGSLRNHCARTLPEVMVPGFIRFATTLPITVSGKIDRAALKTVDLQVQSTEPFVAPASPVEKTLAAIWSDLVGGKQVGVLDNFFALGGHSLAVMRCLSRIRDAFGVKLPVRTFFEAPTIATLSPLIVQALADAQPAISNEDEIAPGESLTVQLAQLQNTAEGNR